MDSEEEPGLNLDNDSLIVHGDNGIPIKDFHGHATTLTHEEQARMRTTFGCGHKNMSLTVWANPGRMEYKCEDCGVGVIEGHVTTFTYRKDLWGTDVNNPFITGQH